VAEAREMEEILKLQEQLRKAQETETKLRLSERNCIELVLKLIKTKQIKVNVTLDGKEYVTPKQLEYEIKDELTDHSGRINILELQPLLNIDLSRIESKISEMVKRDKKLRVVNGDLIAKYYFDGVAKELNETLQEYGQISLHELAKRFSLNIETLEEEIKERLGIQVEGTFEGGTLYTDVFVARCRAQLRGTFSAITKPTSVRELLSKQDVPQKLFYGILKDLQEEGILAGKVERGVFCPLIFEKFRRQWIESFFAQNGFIEYSNMKKVGINDPLKLLEELYPNGAALDSCFVSENFIRAIDANVEESIHNQESWIDVMRLVEFSIGTRDCQKLIRTFPSLSSNADKKKRENHLVLGDQYVVNKKYLERCVLSFRDFIDKNIAAWTEDYKREAKKKGGAKKKGKNNKRKPARGKRNRRNQQEEEEEEEEDITMGVFDKNLDQEKVVELLEEWYPNDDPNFLYLVAEKITLNLKTVFRESAEKMTAGDSSNVQENYKDLEKEFNIHYKNLFVFFQSADQFPDSRVGEQMGQYIKGTICKDLIGCVVKMQAVHYSINIPSLDSLTDIEKATRSLPNNASQPVLDAITCLKSSGKGLEDFQEEVSNLCKKVEIFLKKPNIRSLIREHQFDQLTQFKEADQPESALYHAIVCLYAKQSKNIVYLPFSHISKVLDFLEDEEAVSILREFSDNLSRSKDPEADVDPPDLNQFKNDIQDFM